MKTEMKKYCLQRKRDRQVIICFEYPRWMKFFMRFCRLRISWTFFNVAELDLLYKDDGSFRESIHI